MSKPRWSTARHRHIMAEGWWLSQRMDGYWEIQRLDEEERFASDEEALEHVKARAQEGSALHRAALRLNGTKIRSTNRKE